MMVSEIIPADHTRMARDKLRRLKQLGSVEKYLTECSNVVLIIGDINGIEKMNLFIDGFKIHLKVEVMKSNCISF